MLPPLAFDQIVFESTRIHTHHFASHTDSSPPAIPFSPPPTSPPPPVLIEPFPPSPPFATGDAPGSAIDITVPGEVYGSTAGLSNRADMLGFGGKGPDIYYKFTSPKVGEPRISLSIFRLWPTDGLLIYIYICIFGLLSGLRTPSCTSTPANRISTLSWAYLPPSQTSTNPTACRISRRTTTGPAPRQHLLREAR